MFSVIIPLYNKSPYILKTISSVLYQTNKEFELIVVNDGSTDDSLVKVQSLIDKRLIIINQKNSGVSAARNNGVENAKYELIAFLDADDWWDINFLEEMKNLIDEFPIAGIYGSKYFSVKNGQKKESINSKSRNFKGYIDYFSAYTFAWWMPLTSSSVVIPKKVFIKERGFKNNLKFAEDFDLWVRIALKYKVCYLNKPLSFYNQDVVFEDRAIGLNKFYLKENHCIFNLEFLKDEEKKNPELKKLIDGLKLRTLVNYYLHGKYLNEIQIMLKNINFKNQDPFYYFVYRFPKLIVKYYYLMKKLGSKVKQYVIRFILRSISI